MSKSIQLFVVCLTLTLLAGQAQAFPGQTKQETPAPQAATVEQASIKGSVVETVNVGSYTYLCLENEGKKRWAAVPATEVKVGSEVEVATGLVMNNFTSRSLGRTFDQIIFSQGILK